MKNLKGWKTIGFNLLLIIAPVALTYLASINWTDYLNPNWAAVAVGVVGLLLRLVTNTAPGKAAVVLLVGGSLVLCMQAAPADATDINKAQQFSLPGATCSATSCTGITGGLFFGGLGNNANVIGNGINGSFNSGGMMPGASIGYQWFDGKFLMAMEVMGGYQFNSNAAISGASGDHAGPFAIIIAKAGAPLSALAPSFSIPNLPLAVVTPYLAGGEMLQAHGGTGGVGGGGIEFALPGTNGAGSSNFLDIMYLNGGGTGTAGNVSTSNNNMVFAKFTHLF